jgi:hypothetical protein
VAAKKEVTKAPVNLRQPSRPSNAVSVRISTIKPITAKAQLPGEVAGPALALTVKIDNQSPQRVDLGSVLVTLADSSGAPGGEMSARPARPLKGRLASQKSASGVYVFTVDEDRRDPIMVLVTLAGETPVLAFKGNAS